VLKQIGRPVAFALTPGNVADVVMAVPLLGAVANPKRLLADKADDADRLRRWLKQRKSGHSLHRLSARAIPARSRLPISAATSQRHRTHVLQTEELATPRNPIRPPRSKLSLRPRLRCCNHRMDLVECPTEWSPADVRTAATRCALISREEADPENPTMRIPTQSGRGFRFDVGRRSDLMSATIPK
jgi:hypothetical protein